MPFSSKSFVANFANIISYIFMNTSMPRQVEKFWTGTDWESFLGGIWGGLLTSTENLENFGNSWGGQGPNWGGTDFPKFFWGGGILSHPRGTAEVCND